VDKLVIGGVSLLIYPAKRLQGRWSVDGGGRFDALISNVNAMIAGELPGWIEAIREGVTKYDQSRYVYCYDASAEPADNWLYWSSFGGDSEGNDFCLVGVPAIPHSDSIAISRRALIELLTVLLERSGLDPTKSPPPLPPFDPSAPYASLPAPPPPPRKPPMPLRENVDVMRELDWRIEELNRNRDSKSAYEQRKQLLVDMREMGFLREDLVTPTDVSSAYATSLWALLMSFEELRKYYRSAYRKTVFGTEPVPNVVGGPLSHQFFLNCRLWYANAKERTLSDHRETRHKIIVPDDQHPHEILAILETEMRRLADLSGDFGERRVEHDTFKALVRWEREDGVHASLTFASVDSW
jgi:hypothetical protein